MVAQHPKPKKPLSIHLKNDQNDIIVGVELLLNTRVSIHTCLFQTFPAVESKGLNPNSESSLRFEDNISVSRTITAQEKLIFRSITKSLTIQNLAAKGLPRRLLARGQRREPMPMQILKILYRPTARFGSHCSKTGSLWRDDLNLLHRTRVSPLSISPVLA